MRKENIICLSGATFPLLIGLFIYLTAEGRTYISECAGRAGIVLPSIDYPQVIRNHVCDFLWGFALFSGLRFFADKSRTPAISALIALSVAVSLEVIQALPIIPGTFDPIDILTETAAVMAAMFISTLSRRLITNEQDT